MKHETQFTIDSLTIYFSQINVDELMPALLSIENKDRLFANNYIKKTMDRSNNKLLYDLYVFFLAECNSQESLNELHTFLDQQEALNKNNQPLNIDKDFVLNVCKYFDRKEAQVRVYGMLGMYEEAVKLALKIPKFDLAKHYASMPCNEKEIKNLWIEIAQAIIETAGNKIKACFDIINESKNLTFLDLLKFLPPKEKLNTFHAELKQSLRSNTKKIEDAKQKMEDYNRSAQEVANQLKMLQSSSIPIASNQCCHKCNKQFTEDQKIYAFPCLHVFHQVIYYV